MAVNRKRADAEPLSHLLDESEQTRAERFRFAEDRNAYVAAHALLRVMLADASGTPAREWQFLTVQGDKPYIHPSLGQPDLRFSLSHSRRMVACAVGRSCEVGVDVEACCRTIPVLEMARRLFAASEVQLLEKLESEAQISMFYRLWTLKEAHAKATGRGITVPLNDFAFLPGADGETLSPQGLDDPEAWQFHEFGPDPQHRIALAVRRRAADLIKLDSAALTMQECLERARNTA